MKYELDKEISNIIEENKHRLSVAMVMEIVDEISDYMCEEIAEELNVEYEELHPKFQNAKRRIEKILKDDRE